MITFLTFTSIVYLYILVTRWFFRKIKNKSTRNAISGYIKVLTSSLKLANDRVKIMELNDRYVIDTDIEIMGQFGTIKVFKGDKKILFGEQYLDLTIEEYDKIVELIKPKL